MELRKKSEEWYQIPQYHGRSLENLIEIHETLPELKQIKRLNFDWKLSIFVALNLYQGYLTSLLQAVADSKDVSIVSRADWNEFVQFLIHYGHKYRNTFPAKGTVVEVNGAIAVVVGIAPDSEYYPGEERHHHAIWVRTVDTSVQESNQIVYDADNAIITCLEDLDVVRRGKSFDTPRYLQSIMYGLELSKKYEVLQSQNDALEEKVGEAGDWVMGRVMQAVNGTLHDGSEKNNKRRIFKVSCIAMDEILSTIKNGGSGLETIETNSVMKISGSTASWQDAFEITEEEEEDIDIDYVGTYAFRKQWIENGRTSTFYANSIDR